ncbi:MAG: MGMT family protein [Ardenticatenaceae bacterium]|nr:MGMT family protein [Ardenticatenaceae bacterium]MCB9444666.1 MGMT family protein [Ardenticatenaceae bacterium]
MNYTSPPNPQAFYEQVWHLVRQVPHGKVVTYGQVAQMLPLPGGIEPQEYKAFGPRWVGEAMAACPDDVPWQRVINSQGKISPRPGADRQRQLLEAEGIPFVKDKVNLKAYQWRGPGHEDEPRQARLF